MSNSKILNTVVVILIIVVLFWNKLKFMVRYNRDGNVTEHFKWAEFDCKDGTAVPEVFLDNVKTVAKQLEVIREAIGNKAIYINSAYRTPSHNEKVGGVKDSFHLRAKAVDIRVKGLTTDQLYNVIKGLMDDGTILCGGLGKYKTFVHYDIRGWFSTWEGAE